jgi:hypothetical protein
LADFRNAPTALAKPFRVRLTPRQTFRVSRSLLHRAAAACFFARFIAHVAHVANVARIEQTRPRARTVSHNDFGKRI